MDGLLDAKSHRYLASASFISFKAKMRGSLATNIATAPAPCVGSPPEFNPYFAISAATTKTFYLDVRLRDS